MREHWQKHLIDLADRGGPTPEEYPSLTRYFAELGYMLRSGAAERGDVRRLWDACGDAFSERTLQGFVCRKPLGYAGDFRIIEKIYDRSVSDEADLRRWDEFFHWQPATEAVRNRKSYFVHHLERLEASAIPTPTVLSVGSGPCRAIREYLDATPATRIEFDCVDMDPRATRFAKRALRGAPVRFHVDNAFHFSSERRFDLVWSAGLFDYLSDSAFRRLLSSLIGQTKESGEVVIGNFSPGHPSVGYMEFGEWFLNYRSEAELLFLAAESGAARAALDSEPLGVNLFLRAHRTAAARQSTVSGVGRVRQAR